jgi:hypothetical protein
VPSAAGIYGLVVTFPSGPLAGDLTVRREVPVQ